MRVQQTVGANVTKYLLDLQPGLSVVLAETTGANVIRNVHAPRGIHAHKDAAGAWEWMMQDGLGSVRGVVDNTVGVLESRNYDPYGESFGTTGSSQTNFGFTGEPTDTNGLLYLRARYYNPAAGVFTALDPFEGIPGRPISLNGYSWVEGNTPNMVDPSGKSACLNLPVLQPGTPTPGQSSCPPSTGGTSCQNFISEVRCIIEMTKQQLREYCNTYWFECILRPPDEKAVVVDILAGYYAGLDVNNYLNWLPQLPTFRDVERYSSVNGVAVDVWNSQILENTQAGSDLRAAYGFRSPYYANTHHYFSYLKFAYYYGNASWLPHKAIEMATLQGAIDDINDRIQEDLPIDDQLKRYKWLYQESVNDLYIVSRAYDVAKLIAYFGVDLLPDALEDEWCADEQAGDSDVQALQSEVAEFYRDFPEWYWPENVNQRYGR